MLKRWIGPVTPTNVPDAGKQLETYYDVQEELQFHLEMSVAENLASGMTEEEAWRTAEGKFGNLGTIRNECLRIKSSSISAQLIHWGTSAAMLALSFAVFFIAVAVFNAVWYRAPLTYKHSPGWVAMWWDTENGGLGPDSSIEELASFQENSAAFEAITAVRYQLRFVRGVQGKTERVMSKEVSTNYFSAHQVAPVIGRDFNAGDADSLSANVVILSHEFWREEFGESATVLDGKISLDGDEFNVIGVAPPDFRMYNKTDLFLPLKFEHPISGTKPLFLAAGQLKPGKTIEDARQTLNAGLAMSGITTSGERKLKLRPVQEVYASPVRHSVWALFVVAMLLLCLSLVNFFKKQMQAIAGNWFWYKEEAGIQKIVLGNIGIVILAGGLGIGGAMLLQSFVNHRLLGEFSHLYDITLDSRVALVGLAVLAGICGILAYLPYLKYKSGKKSFREKPADKGIQHRGNRSGVYRLAFALELGFAVAVFVCSGFLLKSTWTSSQGSPGYNPENVLSMSISMPAHRYNDGSKRVQFLSQFFQAADSLPGLQAASVSFSLPESEKVQKAVVAQDNLPSVKQHTVLFNRVGLDYLQIMGISLEAGRFFSSEDLRKSLHSVVVNEAFVERVGIEGDPLGRLIYAGTGKLPVEIIGVVRNIKREATPELFALFWNFPTQDAYLLFNVSDKKEPVIASIKQALWSIDPEIPVYDVALVSDQLAQKRNNRLLVLFVYFLICAGALLFAWSSLNSEANEIVALRFEAIGSYDVTEQSRIRLRWLVLKDLLPFLGFGMVTGYVGALSLIDFLGSHLLEIWYLDHLAFTMFSIVIGIVLFVYAIISSGKALHVDRSLAFKFANL